MDEDASYRAASQEGDKTILGEPREAKVQRNMGATHRNETAGMGAGLHWLEAYYRGKSMQGDQRLARGAPAQKDDQTHGRLVDEGYCGETPRNNTYPMDLPMYHEAPQDEGNQGPSKPRDVLREIEKQLKTGA